MAHTGPKRNNADPSTLFYLQWHTNVDSRHHGRRSLDIIQATEAEAKATAAMLECVPLPFVTVASGTHEYCVNKRKYFDKLIEQMRNTK